jgi:hypothetical protein
MGSDSIPMHDCGSVYTSETRLLPFRLDGHREWINNKSMQMTHLGERRHRAQAAQHETNDQCPCHRRC